MQPEVNRRQLLLMAWATEGGLAVVACVLGWFLGFPPWEAIVIEPTAFVRGVIITLPMLVLFFVCVRWPVGPLVPIKHFVDEVVKPLFAQCSVFDLAVIALLAGIGEEMLFRGVLQPAFVHWWGLWPGIIAASVLFGLAHPITPAYFVLATLIGVYLGYLTHWSGNLLDVILAHALYDFVGLLYLVKSDSSSQPALNPVHFEDENEIEL